MQDMQALKWYNIKDIQQIMIVTIATAALLTLLFVGMQKKAAQPIFIDGQGLSRSEQQQLQQTSQQLGNQQFFYADLPGLARTFTDISWVDSVALRRDWEKGIVLSVTPKKAVANFGSTQMIDARGEIFVPADDEQLNNPNLIYLKTDAALAQDAMSQMYHINEWFAGLGMHLVDVTLTARGTWLLRFNNGLRITVDKDRSNEKLYNLANLLKGDNEPASKKDDIGSIDLRYKNGFTVEYKAHAPNDLRQSDDFTN